MKNKGFTLLELLAIIVILAVIAVVTVPIILNIIDNSKKGATTNSAYGYKTAVENYLLTRSMKDSEIKLSTDYIVSDGNLINEIVYEIPVNGSIPRKGKLTIENGHVKTGCITFDEYQATFTDGKVTETKKGNCETNNISAIDLAYENELRTECDNIQCAIDELYEMLGE